MKSLDLAKSIRLDVVEMTSLGNSSHVASGLSIADILAVLYSNVMIYEPDNPVWDQRDRFILSKGHAGAAVYSALARSGFFDPLELKTHCGDGSRLSGHVSHKGVPGVEFSTGSLGHGLGVGCGMSFQLKRSAGQQRVFVVLSDGECDEGSVWEAALFASHHKLNNLVAIIDYNKLQSIKTISETLALEPFRDKWESFGWKVLEVDGHDHGALTTALGNKSSNLPTVVIAHTTKGKGVSFMENSVLWHYRSPQGIEFSNAIDELQNS